MVAIAKQQSRVPIDTFVRGMHRYQKELFGTFDRRWYIDHVRISQMFLAEWHRRCRKTTAAINLLIKEAVRIPKAKYVYIAPTQVMARNIVWDDPMMLRHYLPPKNEIGWKLNEQKMLVTFDNKTMIKIGGADEPDSLRGIDAIGVVPDEYALMKPQVWTEIFRPIIAGSIPPHLDMYDVFRWALFLYTPKGMNHASEMFDNACCLGAGGSLPDNGVAGKLRKNWFASRVDGELSGIFTDEELKRMREEMPQAFYDQEIRCSRITAEEMTLITTEMIYNLNEYVRNTTHTIQGNKKIVSIDPAWGGDVCKMMGLVNCRIKAEKSIRDRHNITEIVMQAKLLAQEIGTKNFIVDDVNSPGVSDLLVKDEVGYNVQRFKSSHKAREKEGTPGEIVFANKRAEAYHYTSRKIARKEVGEITSKELMRQLPIASRYTTQGGSGRLIIIPKLKIKEELGCSPDEADTYVMGIWGSQKVRDETAPALSASDFIPSFIGK